MKKKDSSLNGMAPDRSDTAMLVVDLISDFRFPCGGQLFQAALPVAKRIAQLKRRAKAAGIPVIYVNDNIGRWRSDFPGLVRQCAHKDSPGAPIVSLLIPDEQDYCLLKPKHSAFFATPLDTILEYVGAEKLIITGVSSNQCVLFTANDAYVRDLELHIPNDCIASPTRQETAEALRHFEKVLGAKVSVSTRMRLEKH